MIQKIINKFKTYTNRYNNKDPVIVKIENLKLYLDNNEFNPYLSKIKIFTLHKDIVEYNNALNNILIQDISKDYIKILPMDRYSILEVHISTFWTDKGILLPNTYVMFKEWLEASKELIEVYNINIELIGSGIPYSNAVKLQPYITNIKKILEILNETIVDSR